MQQIPACHNINFWRSCCTSWLEGWQQAVTAGSERSKQCWISSNDLRSKLSVTSNTVQYNEQLAVLCYYSRSACCCVCYWIVDVLCWTGGCFRNHLDLYTCRRTADFCQVCSVLHCRGTVVLCVLPLDAQRATMVCCVNSPRLVNCVKTAKHINFFHYQPSFYGEIPMELPSSGALSTDM